MQIGYGIARALDGKHYVNMQINDVNTSVSFMVTGEENFEDDLKNMIDALTQIRLDMRHAISGLITVQEVPNGIRQPEGRKQQRKGG